MRHDWRRFFTLGLQQNAIADPRPSFVGSTRALPFVLHWALLLVISLTVLHVQVVTRFMSAVAPLYWFASAVLYPDTNIDRAASGLTFAGRTVFFFSFGYAAVGTCLFCAFLPWT